MPFVSQQASIFLSFLFHKDLLAQAAELLLGIAAIAAFGCVRGGGKKCRRGVGMEQECLGVIGKGDCNQREGIRGAWKVQASARVRGEQGWGHGIRRINGAGEVLGKRGI